MQHKLKPLSIAILSFSTMFSSSAFTAGLVLEEVVITVQKREEGAQTVPMAVNSFNGDDLADVGALDGDAIAARTPGLAGGKDGDSQNVLTMRGVGTAAFAPGTDNSVGTYFNEAPMSRVIGSGGFMDVERIEVVKGPQGTLFGRNTASGAISVTNNPADLTESGAEIMLGAGNEEQQQVELIGNLAVSDTFAMRLAAKHDERDGTYTNTTDGKEMNGRDHSTYRFSLQWDASDAVNVKWFWERGEKESYWGVTNVADGIAFGNEVTLDPPTLQDSEYDFTVLNVTADLGSDLTLTSTTSVLDSDNILSADADGAAVSGDFTTAFDTADFLLGNTATPPAAFASLCEVALPLLATGDPNDVLPGATCVLTENWEIEQFTQDFRLNGTMGKSDWFVGVSYYHEEVKLDAGLDWGGFFPDDGLAINETDSWAIYGDWTYAITDQLNLTVGARYTIDDKEASVDNSNGFLLNAPTAGKVESDDDWSSFDPRVALDYQIDDNVLIYASYAKGYKAGGFNKQPDATGTSVLSVEPEENDAYEVGVKADLLDDRARVNAAVFFYDYSDFQIEAQSNGAVNIFNAGDLETSGFELDGTLLVGDSLDIRVAYAYLNTEFQNGEVFQETTATTISLKGREALRAPENTYSVSGTHYIDTEAGTVKTRVEYLYTDEMGYDIQYRDGTMADDYELINASIDFESEDETWGVTLIGENLTDEEYITSKVFLFDPAEVPGMGTLWRVQGRYRF